MIFFEGSSFSLYFGGSICTASILNKLKQKNERGLDGRRPQSPWYHRLGRSNVSADLRNKGHSNTAAFAVGRSCCGAGSACMDGHQDLLPARLRSQRAEKLRAS